MRGGVIWVGRGGGRRRAAEGRRVKAVYCKTKKSGWAVLRTRKRCNESARSAFEGGYVLEKRRTSAHSVSAGRCHRGCRRRLLKVTRRIETLVKPSSVWAIELKVSGD